MLGDNDLKGFVLTRQWRDTPNGVLLDLWVSSDNGPYNILIPEQKALFFVRQSDQPLLADILRSFPSVVAKPLALNNSHGEPVLGVYCQQQKQLNVLCEYLRDKGVECWEDDVRPTERFLMERFITSGLQWLPNQNEQQHFNTPESTDSSFHTITTQQIKTAEYTPELSVVSIDIETSMDAKSLYSIAAYSESESIVFMVSQTDYSCPENKEPEDKALIIKWCRDARDCLQQFLAWIRVYDPDILIGWHVVQFDCWVLEKLCQRWQVPFTLGRNQQKPHWRVEDKNDSAGKSAEESSDAIIDRKRRYIQVPGRVVLDGIELLRIAFYQFDSFSLQSVANELLDDSKLLAHDDRGQAITDLFSSNNLEDKVALAKYNLHDCKLVWDIFEKTKLLDFAIVRSKLTGMPMDKMGGSVASFDYAYLPRLHRQGYVAPNLGELQSDVISPGGYVMNSLPGLYQHVLVLDFKSLYPSIIRTFAIDPYAFWYAQHHQLDKADVVDGYNGAFFARDHHILPALIEDLWRERDHAKAEKNQPLSHAIKIIMNSFYGILGSQGCRFFDPRVCSSITLRGHDIIQKSHQWIEQQGYQVIYGDTDSLFVWLGEDFALQKNTDSQAQAIGNGLAQGLNIWWQEYLQKQFSITSALEIEFETHYHEFLMPTIRGSEQGSKKRYAGTVKTGSEGNKEIVFKGLETVRTDWTALAKEFQQVLYQMIFNKEAYHQYIQLFVADVWSGKKDDLLVYRKRLRRPLVGYEKSNPPHVKAARKLEKQSNTRMIKGDAIDYVITLNGPEPIEYQVSKIDYQHYIDKQLKPIADSILNFLDDSFDQVVQKQMALL